MRKTWLEVALNGPWGKARQPRIPVRVEDIVAEGIACAGEGAAIIHVHACDEASGRQQDSAELYGRIIEGIRQAVDCIVYPTIPFVRDELPATQRFAAVESLGRRGLLEWAVVDPGSVNLELAVARGGHVRVGLEDAPFGSERSNLDWQRAGRKAIERSSGRLASAAEVRAALM